MASYGTTGYRQTQRFPKFASLAPTPTPTSVNDPNFNALNANDLRHYGSSYDSTAPAPAPAQAAGAAPAAVQANPYDLSGDPILAKIRALGQQSVADAQAAAQAAQKKALIDFGGGDLARSLGGGEDTAKAAEQNPFSTLANLLKSHQQATDMLDQTLNKANLFYGSERGRQLGLEGQNYLGQQASAQNSLQGLLSGINQAVLGAQQGAQGQELSGEQGAYDRALQFALANPGGGQSSAATPLTVGGTPAAPPSISDVLAATQAAPTGPAISSLLAQPGDPLTRWLQQNASQRKVAV